MVFEMLCGIAVATKPFEVMKFSQNRRRCVLIHCYDVKMCWQEEMQCCILCDELLPSHFEKGIVGGGRNSACRSPCVGVDVYSGFLIC